MPRAGEATGVEARAPAARALVEREGVLKTERPASWPYLGSSLTQGLGWPNPLAEP